MAKTDIGEIGNPDEVTDPRTFTIDARPDAVSDIRRLVADLARRMPFTDQDIEDIKLAVGEATSNAIRYGSPRGERSRVTIHCEQAGDHFIVEIADEGCGFDMESRVCRDTDTLDEHGRGLWFMQQLMDDVSVECKPGAVVRMIKRLKEGSDPRD